MSTSAKKILISVSGNSKDVSFLAGFLRSRKIPYKQALAFAHTPILQISDEYTAQLEKILTDIRPEHPINTLSAQEVNHARDIFWIMIAGVVGILSIAWARYFISLVHH